MAAFAQMSPADRLPVRSVCCFKDRGNTYAVSSFSQHALSRIPSPSSLKIYHNSTTVDCSWSERAGAGVRCATQLPGCDLSYSSEVKINRMREKRTCVRGKKDSEQRDNRLWWQWLAFPYSDWVAQRDRTHNHNLTHVWMTVNNTSRGMLSAATCVAWQSDQQGKISKERRKCREVMDE